MWDREASPFEARLFCLCGERRQPALFFKTIEQAKGVPLLKSDFDTLSLSLSLPATLQPYVHFVKHGQS